MGFLKLKYSFLKRLLFVLILFFNLNAYCQDFKKVNFFDKLNIFIPETWQELEVLPNDFKEISSRPDRVFSDKNNPIKLQLSFNKNSLNESSIDELREKYYLRFKEIYPDAIYVNNKSFNVNSFKVALIETIDSNNYNFIFFTSYLGKQVHFVIQSSKDRYEIDKVTFNEILNSLNIDK